MYLQSLLNPESPMQSLAEGRMANRFGSRRKKDTEFTIIALDTKITWTADMGLEKLKHCRWLLLPFVLFRRFWIFLPKHQTWRNQNSPQNTEWVASIIRKTLQIRIRMCSKKRKKHVHRVISSKFEAVKNFNSLFMWPCPLLCHVLTPTFKCWCVREPVKNVLADFVR